ncbi:MAG: hypothetical protein ACXVYY_01155 [Oryzihumus sp.]
MIEITGVTEVLSDLEGDLELVQRKLASVGDSAFGEAVKTPVEALLVGSLMLLASGAEDPDGSIVAKQIRHIVLQATQLGFVLGHEYGRRGYPI